MSKAIYIATTEPSSGKSIVSLGLMHMLLGKAAKVGYFRPIIDDYKHGEIDNHINTVITHFGLKLNYEDAYAFTRSEMIHKKNQNEDDEIISTIIEKYKVLEDNYDFVLVEGTDFSGEGSIIELDMNIIIAKNLNIPTIIIASGVSKTLDELVGNLHIAYDSFKDKGVEVLSVIANKVKPKNTSLVISELQKNLPSDVLINAIPLNAMLANPTIKEIVEQLNGKVLFGKPYLNNQAGCFSVGAMQLRNYLKHLHKNSLVITPGDRADIILGSLQANLSTRSPLLPVAPLAGGLIPYYPYNENYL